MRVGPGAASSETTLLLSTTARQHADPRVHFRLFESAHKEAHADSRCREKDVMNLVGSMPPTEIVRCLSLSFCLLPT